MKNALDTIITLALVCALVETIMLVPMVRSSKERIKALEDRIEQQQKSFDDFYEKSFCRLYLSVGDSYRHLRRHERWLCSLGKYPAESYLWEKGNLPLEPEANGLDPARKFVGANMYGFPSYKQEEPRKVSEDGLTPRSWFTVKGKREPVRDESVIGKPKKKFSGKMNILDVGLETEQKGN